MFLRLFENEIDDNGQSFFYITVYAHANIITQHIIVVGCGLAGLTAAIPLARSGHKVEIVEAAPQISYIGAG